MGKEIKQPKIETPKMKSPIEYFFRLGEWATGGDPLKIQDFTYYMLWILFLAFFTMFVSNMYLFFTTWGINYIIWGGIGFAICSLQYFNLKNFYMMRKARKEMKNLPKTHEEDTKVENVEEMLKEFKK